MLSPISLLFELLLTGSLTCAGQALTLDDDLYMVASSPAEAQMTMLLAGAPEEQESAANDAIQRTLEAFRAECSSKPEPTKPCAPAAPAAAPAPAAVPVAAAAPAAPAACEETCEKEAESAKPCQEAENARSAELSALLAKLRAEAQELAQKQNALAQELAQRAQQLATTKRSEVQRRFQESTAKLRQAQDLVTELASRNAYEASKASQEQARRSLELAQTRFIDAQKKAKQRMNEARAAYDLARTGLFPNPLARHDSQAKKDGKDDRIRELEERIRELEAKLSGKAPKDKSSRKAKKIIEKLEKGQSKAADVLKRRLHEVHGDGTHDVNIEILDGQPIIIDHNGQKFEVRLDDDGGQVDLEVEETLGEGGERKRFTIKRDGKNVWVFDSDDAKSFSNTWVTQGDGDEHVRIIERLRDGKDKGHNVWFGHTGQGGQNQQKVIVRGNKAPKGLFHHDQHDGRVRVIELDDLEDVHHGQGLIEIQKHGQAPKAREHVFHLDGSGDKQVFVLDGDGKKLELKGNGVFEWRADGKKKPKKGGYFFDTSHGGKRFEFEGLNIDIDEELREAFEGLDLENLMSEGLHGLGDFGGKARIHIDLDDEEDVDIDAEGNVQDGFRLRIRSDGEEEIVDIPPMGDLFEEIHEGVLDGLSELEDLDIQIPGLELLFGGAHGPHGDHDGHDVHVEHDVHIEHDAHAPHDRTDRRLPVRLERRRERDGEAAEMEEMLDKMRAEIRSLREVMRELRRELDSKRK